MSKIAEIIEYLEEIAPKALQESYDNAGLIIGDRYKEVTGVVVSLDCTEAVIDEAIQQQANLVVAHHPIVFKGLKSITGKNYVERTIIKAIKHDIAIYAIHTNLDSVLQGVNNKLGNLLGLKNLRILQPNLNNLVKLVTFIPEANTKDVLAAIHGTGAGTIGEYSSCSFSITGTGRYTASAVANPAIGDRASSEEVKENRVEIILPKYLQQLVIKTLKEVHPYEEAAYYLTELANIDEATGAGMTGELEEPLTTENFLRHLKETLKLEIIKYTPFDKKIRKVAICGGSGSFLLNAAISQGVDAFVTADIKYHDFFDAEQRLLYCDIGHYESEVPTKELLYELLTKKFTNFALHLSEIVTNPIKYYK